MKAAFYLNFLRQSELPSCRMQPLTKYLITSHQIQMSSDTSSTDSLTYKDAGVDIDAGNSLVDRIKSVAANTRRPEVMSSLGGFGALCEIPGHFKEPVLVSGTDGVGTKLKLAIEFGIHNTIGIDLVAMCVNDLVVTGAEPLQFLDYYATGKLDVGVAADVVEGIGKGCELSGCALVGGETAEMPGMYDEGDYDLAGFCVGVVEKSKIIEGTNVYTGNKLIALPSSGIHSNGYSLVRKILEAKEIDATKTKLGDKSLAEVLLEPTRIYVKPILALLKHIEVRALAHITGGGILENLPRVMPKTSKAMIDTSSWDMQEIFNWLKEQGNIDDLEMMRTFNCGVGMILVIAERDEEAVIDLLHATGEQPFVIGEIRAREGDEEQVELI